MQAVLTDFSHALHGQNGYALAETLSPIPPLGNPQRLDAIRKSANSYSIQHQVRNFLTAAYLDKQTAAPWTDVYVAYWKAINEILAAQDSQPTTANNANAKTRVAADPSTVYLAWHDLTTAVYRGYYQQIFDAWSIPCLYLTCRHLRLFAISADQHAAQGKRKDDDCSSSSSTTAAFALQDDSIDDDSAANEKQEDAARLINKVFAICLNDRNPLHDSCKWGMYYIASLLFKSYFRINSVLLAKNILKSISASTTDNPALEACPKSHQAAYLYYLGVIDFLDENYLRAEDHLQKAYDICHVAAVKNIQLILTYLIPTRLLTCQLLPTETLLKPHPALVSLFGPLSACIKRGDLAGFDAAMDASESEFVKRRIYLTLERGRDICLRNLVRKVYLAGGYEPTKEDDDDAPSDHQRVRRSRVPIAEITAALRMAGEKDIENDEVECFISNLIYKNLIKGYISRAHGMVVLNKKGDAFPGTTKA